MVDELLASDLVDEELADNFVDNLKAEDDKNEAAVDNLVG